MDPLAIAYELGYFKDEGLFVTPCLMDPNGSAITVSNEVWDFMRPHVASMDDGRLQHPIGAESLVPVVETMIDGVPYDGRTPNAYIDSFPIGLAGAQLVIDGLVSN